MITNDIAVPPEVASDWPQVRPRKERLAIGRSGLDYNWYSYVLERFICE
jgi:hypothetical protein